MRTISIEFCLATLLLILIFITNVLHILYLIIYKHSKAVKSARSILINLSLSSILVSIWLIPSFYFRTVWSVDSVAWRLWSFGFHVVDAVQLYSLLLLVTTRSFQRIFIGFVWLTPIIAYSPLLWLTSPSDQLDHMPYRRFTIDIPWWILPILYFSMYIIPIIISLILTGIHLCWPVIFYYYKQQNKNCCQPDNYEHQQDMTELTTLVKTIFNFQLEQSTHETTCAPSFSNNYDRSLAHRIGHHESFFLFDDLSICSLLQTSLSPIEKPETSLQQPLNSYILFIITCLLLLVHLPYILLSFFDLSTLQLSIFIYVHWFGTLFVPMVHIA